MPRQTRQKYYSYSIIKEIAISVGDKTIVYDSSISFITNKLFDDREQRAVKQNCVSELFYMSKELPGKFNAEFSHVTKFDIEPTWRKDFGVFTPIKVYLQ